MAKSLFNNINATGQPDSISVSDIPKIFNRKQGYTFYVVAFLFLIFSKWFFTLHYLCFAQILCTILQQLNGNIIVPGKWSVPHFFTSAEQFHFSIFFNPVLLPRFSSKKNF